MKKRSTFKLCYIGVLIPAMIYKYFINFTFTEATFIQVISIFGFLSMLIYDEVQYKQGGIKGRTKFGRTIDWIVLILMTVSALDVLYLFRGKLMLKE